MIVAYEDIRNTYKNESNTRITKGSNKIITLK